MCGPRADLWRFMGFYVKGFIYIKICKLLLVDPAGAIRLSRRIVLFRGLKFISMIPLNNDSGKVQ